MPSTGIGLPNGERTTAADTPLDKDAFLQVDVQIIWPSS